MIGDKFMHSFGKNLTLAFIGLCVLGAASARPAAAQNLVYTLSGVTFADGATATGYFDFNPSTDTFGSYNITTTNGVTDSLVGANYTVASGLTSSPPFTGFGTDYVFTADSTTANFHSLVLRTQAQSTSPATYALTIGIISPPTFFPSGEFTPDASTIATGSLIVTNAVPEASTTVSFGLLLMLGGGVVIVARKKKAATSL